MLPNQTQMDGRSSGKKLIRFDFLLRLNFSIDVMHVKYSYFLCTWIYSHTYVRTYLRTDFAMQKSKCKQTRFISMKIGMFKRAIRQSHLRRSFQFDSQAIRFSSEILLVLCWFICLFLLRYSLSDSEHFTSSVFKQIMQQQQKNERKKKNVTVVEFNFSIISLYTCSDVAK